MNHRIDWSNPKARVSTYFSVKEVLWLPSWRRMAKREDGLNDAAELALSWFFQEKMELVRELLGTEIRVHNGYRPPKYNEAIGGAKNSAHIAGEFIFENRIHMLAACDFSADLGGISPGENCDIIRKRLEPMLGEWRIRMERKPGAPWVHLDSRPIYSGQKRYFSPATR